MKIYDVKKSNRNTFCATFSGSGRPTMAGNALTFSQHFSSFTIHLTSAPTANWKGLAVTP